MYSFIMSNIDFFFLQEMSSGDEFSAIILQEVPSLSDAENSLGTYTEYNK